eukprot:340789-Prorocentrum_minimum.AAC.1
MQGPMASAAARSVTSLRDSLEAQRRVQSAGPARRSVTGATPVMRPPLVTRPATARAAAPLAPSTSSTSYVAGSGPHIRPNPHVRITGGAGQERRPVSAPGPRPTRPVLSAPASSQPPALAAAVPTRVSPPLT